MNPPCMQDVSSGILTVWHMVFSVFNSAGYGQGSILLFKCGFLRRGMMCSGNVAHLYLLQNFLVSVVHNLMHVNVHLLPTCSAPQPRGFKFIPKAICQRDHSCQFQCIKQLSCSCKPLQSFWPSIQSCSFSLCAAGWGGWSTA